MEVCILDHAQILDLLPDRDPYAHKGDFGKVLLLCGSRGYTGAAALAAMGCLRSGAGLVYLAVPDCIYAIEAVKLTEPIVLPMTDEMGMFSADAVAAVKDLLPKMNAVLIGPGIGQSIGTMRLLEYVLSEYHGPVVVDADGINLLSGHKDLLRGRKYPTILTPHEGEFSRLAPALNGERLHRAMTFAQEYHCIMVLKGRETIITDGACHYRNTTGNPGMAVGGSGDVLAGMIVGLIGQNIAPLKAVAAAVWLHGAAADACAGEMGQYAMLPTDYLSYLPRLLK